MFKRLKDRIVEEANTRLPGAGQLNNTPVKSLEPENKVTTLSSEDLITLSDSPAVVVPITSSQQFSICDEDGSLSEQSTPQKRVADTSTSSEVYFTPSAKDQRLGNTSDFNIFQEYHPSKSPAYVPQSDIESEREEPPTLNLDGISKTQLFDIIQKHKAKLQNYKNKYSEVTKNYKDLREEKTKIENTLIENQDKGLRRIAELREQCQLEQKAKAHLEENLRLMLEEKDSRISVLETQINLLKSGSIPAENCDIKSSENSSGDANIVEKRTLDVSKLQEKVERLEHVLSQSKNTIIAQKNQIVLLRKQTENLSQELEGKVEMLNELEDKQTVLKSEHETVLSTMQSRLVELEQQQEENVMSMAETKRNMHEELELKEKQLIKAEEEARQYQSAAEHEKVVIAELRKQHEEKINELEKQLTDTEKTLEDEKKNLMQELTRGKTAAVNLMQQELSKKIAATEEEWKEKMKSLQAQYENSDLSKMSNALLETENKLKCMQQKLEESNSAISDLKNQNGALQSIIESLKEEAVARCTNFEKQQVSYNKTLNERETKIKNLEISEKNLNESLDKYKKSENDLKLRLKNFGTEINTKLKEKEVLIQNLNSEKLKLNEQLKNLTSSEKQLQDACSSSKKQIITLKSNIQDLKSEIKEKEEIIFKNIINQEEFYKMQQSLDSSVSEKKITAEKLIENAKKIENYSKLNNELISKNKHLLLKNKDFQNRFNTQENQLFEIKVAFHETNDYVDKILNSLNAKQNMIKDYEEKFSGLGQIFTSLEDEHNGAKSSIIKIETLCEVIQQKLFSCENLCLTQYKKQDYDKKSTDEHSTMTENVVNVNDLAHKINDSKGLESSPQNLQNIIEDLKDENYKLKKEIDTMHYESENQNIVLVKEITQLQKSLSDLQEERNMLSLILQNIEENHSVEKSSSKQYSKAMKETSIDKVEVCYHSLSDTNSNNAQTDRLRTDYVNQISVLNTKVKTEIDFLSAQTEHINNELKTIRYQFENSQAECIEKVAQLNSKLLYRTQLLINVKEELDDTVKNSMQMQMLCDGLRKELAEASEMLANNKKEFDDKFKNLKEMYLKKECELKESHNSQLSELKIQTEFTICKLNETVSKQKENEFAVQDLLKNKFLLENFECNSQSIQVKMEKALRELDVYKGKIADINLNINDAKEKFKIKSENYLAFKKSKSLESENLNNKLAALNDVVKEQGESQNAVTHLKQQLESALLNAELWKSKYENAVSEVKEIFSTGEIKEVHIEDAKHVSADNKEHHSDGAEKFSELEDIKHYKKEYIEQQNLIQSLKDKLITALSELDLANLSLKQEKEKLLIAENNVSLELEAQRNLLSELDSLKKQYDQKEITLKEANHQITKVTSINEKLNNELKKLNVYKTECEKLKKAAKDLQHMLSITSNELERSNSDLEKLKEEYCNKEMVSEEVNLHIIKLSSDLEKSVSEIQELNQYKSECIELKGVTKRLEDTLNNTLSKLEHSNSELTKFKEDCSKKDVSLVESSLQISKLSTDLEKSISQVNELNQVKLKYKEIKDAANRLEESLEKSNAFSEKLSKEYSKKQDNLEEADMQISKLFAHHEKSVAEMNKFKSECIQLKDIKKNLDDTLNNTVNRLQKTDSDLEKLKEEYSRNEASLQEVNQQVTKLSSDLEKSISEVQELRQFKTECFTLKDFLEDLQNILNVTTNILERLNDEFGQWQSTYSETEMSLQDANQQIYVMTTFLKSSIAEVENLKQYKSSCTELQKSYDNILKQLERLKQLLVEEIVTQNLVEINHKEIKLKYQEAVAKAESDEKFLKDKLNKKEIDLEELEMKNKEITTELSNMQSHVDELNLKFFKEKEEFKALQEQTMQAESDKSSLVMQLQKDIETNLSSLLEKDAHIENLQKVFEQEREALISQKEASQKCADEKFQQIEKNYKTQLEEMKMHVQRLEKEKTCYESEQKEKVQSIQSKLEAKVKDSENKAVKDLRAREDELKALHEKYENCSKEISAFQESMKDKENMILKLKANLASVVKVNSEKVDELNRRVKQLEQEQEQLMLQAQERVSATESKCREQLQEKSNQMVLDGKEIEKLKHEIIVLNTQLDESLLVGEANRTSASQEMSLLKIQLKEANSKLTEIKKVHSEKEAELSDKVQNLEKENNTLRLDCDQVQGLKAEKDQLNETLKSVQGKLEEIDNLKGKVEEGKAEIACLNDQLNTFQNLKAENEQLMSSISLLKQSELELKKNIDVLESQKNVASELADKIESLKKENEVLQKKIGILEQFDASDPNNTAVKEYMSIVKSESEANKKLKEDELDSKLKQLVKDFCIQMDTKDKECDQMMSELIEKNENLEEKLRKEHQLELSALRQDMFEKDCAIEEMQDHYVNLIKEKDEKLKEHEKTLKTLSQSHGKETIDSAHPCAEGSDWDDTWAVPEESCENTSPVHNATECEKHMEQMASMQEELDKCQSEIKELRILLRLSPPQSLVSNNNHRSNTQLLPEPTELEYLKNIIYEYMMGKEPVTLAKVIAAVLRFSDVQTQQVIRKEESRHATK